MEPLAGPELVAVLEVAQEEVVVLQLVAVAAGQAAEGVVEELEAELPTGPEPLILHPAWPGSLGCAGASGNHEP